MATHSLKGTFDKLGPQNLWWCHFDIISQSILTKFCIFVCYAKRHLCAKFERNRTRNKQVAKNGKWCHCDIIPKNSSAIFVCEYFLIIPIDVQSFKLIEGQIKELQGVVPNTPPPPGWEWPKKPGQDRVKQTDAAADQQANFFSECLKGQVPSVGPWHQSL